MRGQEQEEQDMGLRDMGLRDMGLRELGMRDMGLRVIGFPRLVAGCLALAVIVIAPTTQAQDFPNRPVKIITDSAPGSAVDVILRVIADRLTAIWGQQVLPVNQPGAGGAIAARLAASSPPDGYTLFIPALSTFVAPPGAAANLPIEVPRDFVPVGFLGGGPCSFRQRPGLAQQRCPS